MSESSWKRRDFHRQAFAPSIFVIGHHSQLVPQFAIGLTVEHTRRRVELPFSDPDRHFGVAPDVLNPPSGFTHFCEQVETLAVDHKPNLNLSRQPRPTT